MKFMVTLKTKSDDVWAEVEFDSGDTDSICYAMGYIGQAVEDGIKVSKIEYKA